MLWGHQKVQLDDLKCMVNIYYEKYEINIFRWRFFWFLLVLFFCPESFSIPRERVAQNPAVAF